MDETKLSHSSHIINIYIRGNCRRNRISRAKPNSLEKIQIRLGLTVLDTGNI